MYAKCLQSIWTEKGYYSLSNFNSWVFASCFLFVIFHFMAVVSFFHLKRKNTFGCCPLRNCHVGVPAVKASKRSYWPSASSGASWKCRCSGPNLLKHNLRFNKILNWFVCTLKFEKYFSRRFFLFVYYINCATKNIIGYTVENNGQRGFYPIFPVCFICRSLGM